MTKRTKKRWSYIAGEKGRNRVRAFEHASGVLMLEFRARGSRHRISLGHRDRVGAKRQADLAAARLGQGKPVRPSGSDQLSLGVLFDMYLNEVTPSKADNTQRHDRRTIEMFARYFGRERAVGSLARRDFERFIQDRRTGRIGPVPA